MAPRRGRDVQLFSFSFVDILATTIGVLLFILLIAVMNQSGMAEYADVARQIEEAKAAEEQSQHALQTTESDLAEAQEATRRTLEQSGDAKPADLAKQARQISAENAKAKAANDASRRRIELLEIQREAQAKRRRAMRSATTASGKKYMLPQAKEGSNESVVHVDCRSDGVTIMGAALADDKLKWRFCPEADIAKADSAFGRLLVNLKKKHLDSVELKNGDVVKGKIVKESKRVIEVNIPKKGKRRTRRVKYPMGLVKRIVRKPKARVVVLWVRPDGIKAANLAIQVTRKAGVDLGWEPADRDWAF
jgi:hypothetical protein